MSQPFRLDGRRALVTGGASGIGEQTVRALALAGAQVLIADLNKSAADALAAEVGGGAAGVAIDVSDPASVAAAFSKIDQLDYLVNNAGVGSVGTIEECAHAEWSRVMRVNIDGPFLVTQAALPLLLVSPHGALVNIGSVAGLVGVKRRFAYCASKGAVIAMTRQLAADYSGRLRANCICPGTVDTPFVDGYLEKYHSHEKEEVKAQLHARQPIGRMGKSAEIAHMALYLCSDEAEFVHGAALEIDGGWTAL